MRPGASCCSADADHEHGGDRGRHRRAAAEQPPALGRDRDALIGDRDQRGQDGDDHAAEQQAGAAVPARGGRAVVDRRAQRGQGGQQPGERDEQEGRQAQPLAHERDRERRDEEQRDRPRRGSA